MGPWTPTTRSISISAELLGPVMKLMQEGTTSPRVTFERMAAAAWVIRWNDGAFWNDGNMAGRKEADGTAVILVAEQDDGR